MKKSYVFVVVVLLATISACTFRSNGAVFVDGKEKFPEKLGINNDYSFRFVEKWRVSHKWFSGPPFLRGCRYSGNPFKRQQLAIDLAIDKNSPRLQWGEAIEEVQENTKNGVLGLRIRLPDLIGSDTHSLGTSRGKFSKFTPLCEGFFVESYDGFGIYIIKPAAEKGTDAWIAGSSEVIVNGRNWLVQKMPPADYGSDPDFGKASLVQRWVLPIPETNYWFVLVMYSSLKYSIMERAEAHKNAERLFDDLIKSVRLDPIQPIIDQKKMIKIENCTRRTENAEVSCPFESGSIMMK